MLPHVLLYLRVYHISPYKIALKCCSNLVNLTLIVSKNSFDLQQSTPSGRRRKERKRGETHFSTTTLSKQLSILTTLLAYKLPVKQTFTRSLYGLPN